MAGSSLAAILTNRQAEMPTPPKPVERFPCHCHRCGHDWEARKPDPRYCPNCNSALWRTEPTETDIKKRHPKPQLATTRRDRLDFWSDAALAGMEVERLNPKRAAQGGKLMPGQSLFTRERLTSC
jgi:hypothetical protein